jgi:hypothetical protein
LRGCQTIADVSRHLDKYAARVRVVMVIVGSRRPYEQ